MWKQFKKVPYLMLNLIRHLAKLTIADAELSFNQQLCPFDILHRRADDRDGISFINDPIYNRSICAYIKT